MNFLAAINSEITMGNLIQMGIFLLGMAGLGVVAWFSLKHSVSENKVAQEVTARELAREAAHTAERLSKEFQYSDGHRKQYLEGLERMFKAEISALDQKVQDGLAIMANKLENLRDIRIVEAVLEIQKRNA